MKGKCFIGGIALLFLSALFLGCGEEVENPVLDSGPLSDSGLLPEITPITMEEVLAARFGDSSAQAAPEGTSWWVVANEAFSWVGVPYRLAGTNRNGIDCSWLVWRVYYNSGAAYWYHTVWSLKYSPYVKEMSYRAPGDLVLFREKINGYEHVGIYLWSGYFIHASYEAGKVVIDHLDNSPYYGVGFWKKYQPYFARWTLGWA